MDDRGVLVPLGGHGGGEEVHSAEEDDKPESELEVCGGFAGCAVVLQVHCVVDCE